MKEAPCRKCEKRELGCHDRCKEYEKFSNYRRSIREEQKKVAAEKELIYESVQRWRKR